MPQHATWIIVIAMMCAQVIGGATGFGAAALAIPIIMLAAPALEMKGVLLPVVAMVGLLMTISLVATQWKQIEWRKALPMAGLTILGVPLGNLAFSSLPPVYLKLALGIFVTAIAVRGLFRRNHPEPWTGVRKYVAMLLPFMGGVIHGAVNSGGPMVVAYAERTLPEKGSFRATISLSFVPMNIYLVVWHAVYGRYTASTLKLAATVAPFAVVGWIAGLMLHGRLSERVFRRMVLVLLLILGCVTTARSLIELL